MNKYVIFVIEFVNGDFIENDINICVFVENKLKVLLYFYI